MKLKPPNFPYASNFNLKGMVIRVFLEPEHDVDIKVKRIPKCMLQQNAHHSREH